MSWYAVGRRGVSSLSFRKLEPTGQYVGITDRPSYADARQIANDLIAAYIDEKLDRVDIIYNHYISPLTQRVTREILLPVSEADVIIGGEEEAWSPEEGEVHEHKELWIYEPGAEEILQRLLPDFVEITVFRALLESTASEHGARMTAMRSASENAEDMISDLTLEANRVRQAEITQEIMEVVAGAEALGKRRDLGGEMAEQNGNAERRPDRGDPERRDRVRLPREAARDLQRDRDRDAGSGRRRVVDARRGGSAAPRRRPRARGGDGLDRRPCAWPEVVDTGGPITVPVGEAHARPPLQPARRADRRRRAGGGARSAGRSIATPPPSRT